MNSHYTEEDSKEVRMHLSKCIHENGGTRQPAICTQAEYQELAEVGCDMSEYMTIQQMEKIVRDNQIKEMRNKNFKLLGKKAG